MRWIFLHTKDSELSEKRLSLLPVTELRLQDLPKLGLCAVYMIFELWQKTVRIIELPSKIDLFRRNAYFEELKYANLKVLDIPNAHKFGWLDLLHLIESLPEGLEKLVIRNARDGFVAIHLRQLIKKCPNLRVLDISGNGHIKKIEECSLPNLTELSAQGTTIDKKTLARILESCTRLQKLNIGGSGVLDLSTLHCENLKELDLSVDEDAPWSERSICYNDKMFEMLPHNVRKTLEVIKVAGQKYLTRIGSFEQLRLLDAAQTKVAEIGDLSHLPLTELSLYALSQVELDLLTIFQRNNMKVLSIEQCADIDDLGSFPNIEVLRLSGDRCLKLYGVCGEKLKKLYLRVHKEKHVIESDHIQSKRLEEIELFDEVYFSNHETWKSFLVNSCAMLQSLRFNYKQNPFDFCGVILPCLKKLQLDFSEIDSSHLEGIAASTPSMRILEMAWHGGYSRFFYHNKNPYKNVQFTQVTQLTLYSCDKDIFFTDFYAIDAMFPNIKKLTFITRRSYYNLGKARIWFEYVNREVQKFSKLVRVSIKEW